MDYISNFNINGVDYPIRDEGALRLNNVADTTGNSKDKVMSQKATTDNISEIRRGLLWGNFVSESDFEIGTIGISDGGLQDEYSDKRIRSVGMVDVSEINNIRVECSDGYKYGFYKMTGDGENMSGYDSTNFWKNESAEYDITDASYLRIVLSRVDDSKIALHECRNVGFLKIIPIIDYYSVLDDFVSRSNFEVGTIGFGDEGLKDEPSTTRIRSVGTINVHGINRIVVKCSTGYKYGFYKLYADGSYIYDEDYWKTTDNEYNISDADFLRIVIAKEDNSTITLDECENVRFMTYFDMNKIVEKMLSGGYGNEGELPRYWMEYLKGKASVLDAADVNLGFNGVSFAFVTDAHMNNNALRSPALLKHIKNTTNIGDVIFGGDLVTGFSSYEEATAELTKWRDLTRELGVINLYGNHDNNGNAQTDSAAIIPESAFYALECRNTENAVKWERNNLYGYKDNDIQKVRYIFLNSKAPDYAVIDDYQVEWMKSKISELGAEWTVIVFIHQFFEYDANYNVILEPCGVKIKNALDEIYDTVNATIAGVVTGHLHRDAHMVSEKGYVMIATTCDAYAYAQTKVDTDNPNRTLGTTTEQCFDLFYVNTQARTIKTIRIGAGDGTNREFTYAGK